MRILVDENVPLATVRVLCAAGHDVEDVRGTSAEGGSDDALWERAQAAERLLITTDKSFASRTGDLHFGVLIVRVRQPNWFLIHERVLRAMALVDAADWPGLVVVMRDTAMGRRRAAPYRRADHPDP
jgi:hypothetical protein